MSHLDITQARIIVIGAGIVGTSIAFHLARRGAQVRILDMADPGQGASAVSFAWINAHDKKPRHYHDLNRRSLDMWDRFARRLGGDIGLSWGGELRWATKPHEARVLKARVKGLQSWGYPIRLLEAKEVRNLEPGLNIGQVALASFAEIDGHVDTRQVIQACINSARTKGLIVHSHTRVTGLQQTTTATGLGQIEALECGNTSFPCDLLVLAGGPDTAALAALAGLSVPLYHTFGATMITEPTAPLFQRVTVVHTPRELHPQINVRQLPDATVMIHGGSHGSAKDGSLGRTEAELDQVMDAAIEYFPALAGLKIREVRRGRRPIPQDGLPILGFSEAVPNLYLAVMHSGVTLAALIGEFAAIEILDQARIDLLEPYRLERFSKIS